MTNVAIELMNVSRKFISPAGKVTLALRDFSLTVNEGDFCAIVGPTGCGKSTTLGMITGLSPPSSGSVRVFGKPVTGIDPNIGFVFQADAVFPWKNVIDNVAIGPIFAVRINRLPMTGLRNGCAESDWQASNTTTTPVVRWNEKTRRIGTNVYQ